MANTRAFTHKAIGSLSPKNQKKIKRRLAKAAAATPARIRGFDEENKPKIHSLPGERKKRKRYLATGAPIHALPGERGIPGSGARGPHRVHTMTPAHGDLMPQGPAGPAGYSSRQLALAEKMRNKNAPSPQHVAVPSSHHEATARVVVEGEDSDYPATPSSHHTSFSGKPPAGSVPYSSKVPFGVDPFEEPITQQDQEIINNHAPGAFVSPDQGGLSGVSSSGPYYNRVGQGSSVNDQLEMLRRQSQAVGEPTFQNELRRQIQGANDPTTLMGEYVKDWKGAANQAKSSAEALIGNMVPSGSIADQAREVLDHPTPSLGVSPSCPIYNRVGQGSSAPDQGELFDVSPFEEVPPDEQQQIADRLLPQGGEIQQAVERFGPGRPQEGEVQDLLHRYYEGQPRPAGPRGDAGAAGPAGPTGNPGERRLPDPGVIHTAPPMQGQVGNAAPPMQGQGGMGITPRRGYGDAMYTRHNFLHPSLRRQLIIDDAMQGRAARKQRLRDRRSGVTARLNQMNPLAAQNWLGQRELMRRNDMLAQEKQAHDIAQAGETNALQRLQEENKVAYQNKELGIREREIGAKRREERMAFLEKALAAAPSREASQAILNEIDRITRDGGGAAPGGAAPGFGDIMAPDPRRWNPGDRVPDQYIDENGEFDVNAARRDGLDTRRINSMRDQHVASPAPLDSLWDSIASGYLGFPSRDTLHDWGIWRRPTLDNRPASGGPPAAQMPSPAQRRRGVEDLYNRFPFVDPAGNRPILP